MTSILLFLSFSTGWRILVFYPEPEARNSKHILASMIYFDSDMSKSTCTIVHFDWKTVIYTYVCGKCYHHIVFKIIKLYWKYNVKLHLIVPLLVQISSKWNKNWLLNNENNVSEWMDVSTLGLLFHWDRSINIHIRVLV
jgi:hypothetical protein